MHKHLYVSVADHGFGHISQSSIVINRLHQLAPEIKITLQCGQAKAHLQKWFTVPFQHIQRATEFGMLMDNAVDVKRAASLQRYRDFHQQWEVKLEQEIRQLKKHQPSLVFANISYLTLAAAQQLGIPNIAMCSLNWADILAGYIEPEDREICTQIRTIYHRADRFIQPHLIWRCLIYQTVFR